MLALRQADKNDRFAGGMHKIQLIVINEDVKMSLIGGHIHVGYSALIALGQASVVVGHALTGLWHSFAHGLRGTYRPLTPFSQRDTISDY